MTNLPAGAQSGIEQQVQDMLDLPDDTFATLVERNLGENAPAALWQLLLHPMVVHRTHEVLTTRFRDVEDQLAQRRAHLEAFRQECWQMGQAGKEPWFSAFGEYQQWRRKALGYHRLLSQRLRQTKQAISGAETSSHRMAPARKARLMDTIFRLAWEINTHRQRVLEAGVVPDDYDVRLWRALEAIEVQTTNGVIPVAKFLADVMGKPGFRPPAELPLPAEESEEEVA